MQLVAAYAAGAVTCLVALAMWAVAAGGEDDQETQR